MEAVGPDSALPLPRKEREPQDSADRGVQESTADRQTAGGRADDSAVMMYWYVTAKRERKVLVINWAYLYRLHEEGNIIEGKMIFVDLYAFDALWC